MSKQAKHILVVDDDQDINSIIATRLRSEGYLATQAFSGTEALLVAKQINADLAICDLMLPGLDGKTVVEQIRETSRIPIIVLSAKTDPSSKIALLKSGADDYLTKPFDLEELVARIEAQLRRSAYQDNASTAGKRIRFGRWQISPDKRTIWIDKEKLELTKTEFDLLALLIEHPRRVFTRAELYEAVWHEPYGDDANTVNTHISYIRSKLKPSGTDCYVKTVWGVGFKLEEPNEQ